MSTSAFASGFDEANFRSAIRETMRMGMPPNDDHKLRWFWRRNQTFVPDSPGGSPYDWTQPAEPDTAGNPTGDPEDDGLIVDYAFDFNAGGGGQVTPLGSVDPSKITVTLFDVDYDRVKTADYCLIGTTRYIIQFSAAPYALFNVTMHDIMLQAEDQAGAA